MQKEQQETEHTDNGVIHSLDPRVTRLQIHPEDPAYNPLEPLDNFETFEVFHQAKTGKSFTHVGSVHAPNPEMAFVYAKEQYGRRFNTVKIWVVRTCDIYTMDDDDSDIFATAPEKNYRNPGFFKVRDRISKFKKEQEQSKQ